MKISVATNFDHDLIDRIRYEALAFESFKLAERAVRTDRVYRDRCLAQYDRVFDDLQSGRMWALRRGYA